MSHSQSRDHPCKMRSCSIIYAMLQACDSPISEGFCALQLPSALPVQVKLTERSMIVLDHSFLTREL